jgi:hypothetical protein
MSIPELPPEILQQGCERLARLLPQAIADAAAANDRDIIKLSAVARAQMRYVTPDNLAAVVVRRAEYGGWSCDVMLKKVPAGIATAFGTPANAPHPTEAEAEASALPLLTFALFAARQVAAEDKPAPRVFEYFGFVVDLPEPLLQFMEQMAAQRPGLRYGSKERATYRLDEISNQLFPDGQVTGAKLDALGQEGFTRLVAVLAMAALEGVFRFPEWRAEPPGKNPPKWTEPAPG